MRDLRDHYATFDSNSTNGLDRSMRPLPVGDGLADMARRIQRLETRIADLEVWVRDLESLTLREPMEDPQWSDAEMREILAHGHPKADFNRILPSDPDCVRLQNAMNAQAVTTGIGVGYYNPGLESVVSTAEFAILSPEERRNLRRKANAWLDAKTATNRDT